MTPASLDELLKKWEASAKVRYSQYKDTDAVLIPVGNLRGEQERILSLIAVVRKQRSGYEAIKELPICDGDIMKKIARIMLEDKEEFPGEFTDAERILNGNKSDTVTKIRVEGGMFNPQKGDFDMKKLFESEEDS